MQNNLNNQGNPLNFLNNIKGLRIASLNVNSIVKHIDEMRILLESKSIDISYSSMNLKLTIRF